MGLNLDYVFAKKAIDNLEDLISEADEEQETQIADDIIKMSEKLIKKYAKQTKK